MKKIGKILLGLFEALFIVYVLFITTCMLCKNKYGYTVFGDQTLVMINKNNGAELTEFDYGDLVTIEDVRFNEIKEGDLLYYYDTVNNQYIIRKGTVAEKQGDANASVYVIKETSASVSNTRIIGEYNSKYPGLGSVLEVLESRLGFLLIVILPILLLFIYQIYKMVLLVKDDGTNEASVNNKKTITEKE